MTGHTDTPSAAGPPLLFSRYPGLANELGWLPLIAGPASVERLDLVDAVSGGRSAGYIKRDDRLGTGFGGNKLRKLEFALGEALRLKRGGVLALGAADSEHTVAVAHHAARLQMYVTCVLTESAPSPAAHRNLARMTSAGARIVHCSYPLLSREGRALVETERALLQERSGTPPFVIPYRGGGSLHAIGYVNAALELDDQVFRGEVRCPDEIFLPGATLATAAGLIVGFKLTRVKPVVCCVPAVESALTTEPHLALLVGHVIDLLTGREASLCCTPLRGDEWRFDRLLLPAGDDAVGRDVEEARRCAHSAGLSLDPGYSAKAFAALLRRVQSRDAVPPTVLFWNTTPPP